MLGISKKEYFIEQEFIKAEREMEERRLMNEMLEGKVIRRFKIKKDEKSKKPENERVREK